MISILVLFRLGMHSIIACLSLVALHCVLEVRAAANRLYSMMDSERLGYCRFLHLVSYSSRYYSYLYAECLAASIWQELFGSDPFDRDAGKPCIRKKLMPCSLF